MNTIPMSIRANALGKNNPQVNLIPIEPGNEEHVYAVNKGISSNMRHEYLAFIAPDTLADTKGWLERVTKAGNSSTVIWGIEVEEKLVGTMTMSREENQFGHSASGGKVLYDPSLDGLGISYLITLARTIYALDVLDISMISSAAFLPNVGSWRSMWKAGYHLSGVDLGKYRFGRLHHELKFELYLPNHPFADNLPTPFSQEMMELLAEDLRTYDGMNDSSIEKLWQLNTARINHREEMTKLLEHARQVIKFV